VRSVRVERPGDLARALEELGLTPPLPTLVVTGGADALPAEDAERLARVVDDIAAVAERLGVAVVDGGTDAGVMRLLGQARARGRSFPLVGVTVAALAAAPDEEPVGAQAPLEANHSHAVLVPGHEWGDETPWLAAVAGVLARGAPSATVVLNGGPIAVADAAASVAAGRRVLVLDGSGRSADALAAAARGEPAEEPVRAVAASPLVHVLGLREDGGRRFVQEIERILSGRG
jgi:SLOG in TRPM, prokaryote